MSLFWCLCRHIVHDEAKRQFKLYDGSDSELFVPPLGFACKTDSVSHRVNSDQLRHPIWAKSLGEKAVNPSGSKMFPTQMEQSMRLHGTKKGEEMYPNELHMRANETGMATFMLCRLLSAQQLKGYAARELSKLSVQLHSLKKQEEKELSKQDDAFSMAAALEAEKQEDSIGFRVERMKGKDLQEELKNLGLKKSGNVR